jgi:hypothetical protein
MSLVTLLPQIDSEASSMSQWAQVSLATIGPLACVQTMSACKSASLFSLSSCVNGRSMRPESYYVTRFTVGVALLRVSSR